MKTEEITLYMSYYAKAMQVFTKLLKIAFFDVFHDKVDKYWKDLYDDALKDKGGFFFKTISGKGKRPNNDKEKETLYKSSLNWSTKKKINAFDLAEYMKQLMRIKPVRDAFYHYYGTYYNNDASKILAYIINTRNNYSHLNEVNSKEICTKEHFIEFIGNCKKFSSFCKKNNVSKKLKNSYKSLISCCDELEKKVGYEPIKIKEFSEENDYTEQLVINCCKKYNIRYDEGVVYEISTDGLINKINEYNYLYVRKADEQEKIDNIIESISSNNKVALNEITNEIKNDLGNEIKKLFKEIPFDISNDSNKQADILRKVISKSENTDEVKENVVKEIKDVYKLPELSHLSHYEKGFLNESQLAELFENYNIFADKSAFLNKSSRNFITNVLIPYRNKNVHKSAPVFLHRSARNELFKLAKMEFDEFPGDHSQSEIEELKEKFKKEKEMAKKAISTINILRKKGLIFIIGSPSYDVSSENMLIDLLKENSNKRFCVITQDKDYADILSSLEIKTLCAVKIAANKPLVWSSLAKNLSSDHNEFISKTLDGIVDDDLKNTDNSSKHISKLKVSDDIKAVQKDSLSSKDDFVKTMNNNKISEPNEKKVEKIFKINKKFNNNIVLPTKGSTLYDSKGKKYRLITPLGSGGEGTIFETQEVAIVAKIYHMENRSVTNYKKLQFMIDKKISMKNVTWPIDILYNDNGDYVGFLMKKTPSYCKQLGESVLKINNTRVRDELLSKWTKADLVNTAYAVASTFVELHAKEIYMGDVNPANILVNPEKSDEVYFVDCDSYQIGEFLCPVGTPIFTSPDYYKKCNGKPVYSEQKRTMQDEQYAIASLIFQILMNGQAPFASKSTGKKDIIDDICNYRFSFKTKDNYGSDVPDGIYKMIWNNLDYDCKNMLSNVFENGRLYSPKQWKKALEKYLSRIYNNIDNDEIKPKKYRDSNGSFVDFECSCCHEEANMHKDIYESITSRYKNPILLCNQCKSIMNNVLKNESVNCSKCGKSFHPTFGQVWRNQEYNYNYVCKSCK